jgi:hypothetical protein
MIRETISLNNSSNIAVGFSQRIRNAFVLKWGLSPSHPKGLSPYGESLSLYPSAEADGKTKN